MFNTRCWAIIALIAVKDPLGRLAKKHVDEGNSQPQISTPRHQDIAMGYCYSYAVKDPAPFICSEDFQL